MEWKSGNTLAGEPVATQLKELQAFLHLPILTMEELLGIDRVTMTGLLDGSSQPEPAIQSRLDDLVRLHASLQQHFLREDPALYWVKYTNPRSLDWASPIHVLLADQEHGVERVMRALAQRRPG